MFAVMLHSPVRVPLRAGLQHYQRRRDQSIIPGGGDISGSMLQHVPAPAACAQLDARASVAEKTCALLSVFSLTLKAAAASLFPCGLMGGPPRPLKLLPFL